MEIRMTKPLEWVNGYLSVSIDRINRSGSTLYLPRMGIYMFLSVQHLTKGPEKDSRNGWLGLYGWFDVVSLDATPLSPGATEYSDICYISPSMMVVNREQETSRSVPFRGSLRISAYYFLTKEDWLKNTAQQDRHYPNFEAPGNTNPSVASVDIAMPCFGAGCRPGCDKPPVVFDGEQHFLFDPSSGESKWIARGKAINKELARKSAACFETDPGPSRQSIHN
jgi:hypothetical protein